MMMIAFGIGNVSDATTPIFVHTHTRSLSQICGPQTFRAKDAPKYWPARVTMVAATAISGVMTILLVSLYVFRNKRRRVAYGTKDERVYEDIDERTDFEIPAFRYVY